MIVRYNHNLDEKEININKLHDVELIKTMQVKWVIYVYEMANYVGLIHRCSYDCEWIHYSSARWETGWEHEHELKCRICGPIPEELLKTYKLMR